MLIQVAANIKSMTAASVAALEQLVSAHLVDIIKHFTLTVCGLSGTLSPTFSEEDFSVFHFYNQI